MKYVATVEIEFETDDDPLDVLHHLMHGLDDDPPVIDHYHIVEQPKELK